MTRSDAYITVSCDRDGCRESVEVQLTATAGRGYDERDVDAALRHEGWTQRDGDDLCAACSEEEEAKP